MDPRVAEQSNDGDASDELDQDREYGCKYCQKKFSNKQALGGHQNAHKLERAVEKNVREIQENHFGYFGGGLAYPGMPVPPTGPFLGSYNRTHHDYLNKTLFRACLNPHIPMPQDMHNHLNPRTSYTPLRPPPGSNIPNHFRYNPRTTYTPLRPMPGSNMYQGRMPATAFPWHGHGHGHGHGQASASSSCYVVPNDCQVFAIESARPNVNVREPDATNDPSDEDSGLDLTLKL